MRILVVEEEPRILAVLARGLEAEGFSVDGAPDGRAGIARAARGQYGLVILDLLLPGLDGFTVLRELQRERPELPVVIVSARSDLETKLRGLDFGACDYVSKPFSLDELLARVRAQVLWPGCETIPFHFIWISLTIVYGFRVWSPGSTGLVLGLVITATGSLILADAFNGEQLWGELFEVPLMSAMFLAMVWHARRRQEAIRALKLEAERRASLLERQERFLHDASHELRTPVTIARGHLEVLARTNGSSQTEVRV